MKPLHRCPCCRCTVRRRLTITPDLLQVVALAYENGGVEQVAEDFNRSRSQAYRLVALARQAMIRGNNVKGRA